MENVIDARVLRMRREAKGWDQVTLARKAGVNPSVISRLERGLQTDLKASVLIALAQALEVSISALLSTTMQDTTPDYVMDLGAILTAVSRLTPAYQRQVAALLYGYLVALPTEEPSPFKEPHKEEP